MTYCGMECCKDCGKLPKCGGCEKCNGHPFGGSCIAERNREFGKLKQQLITEINALGIHGLQVEELYLLSGAYVNLAYPLANGYTGGVTGILGKSNLAQAAFGTVFGSRFGAIFVAVCLFFFAFSTVLSWNLFGKINAIYLFGRKNAKVSTAVYTLIALVFIFLGTLMSNDLVWELTDLFNNLMVLPNALALFALTGTVVAIARSKTAK